MSRNEKKKNNYNEYAWNEYPCFWIEITNNSLKQIYYHIIEQYATNIVRFFFLNGSFLVLKIKFKDKIKHSSETSLLLE